MSRATPTPEGTYVVASDRLVGRRTAGTRLRHHPSRRDDLLIGTLERPAAPAAALRRHRPRLRSGCERRHRGSPVPVLYLATGGALALGLLLGATIRRSRPALSLTGLVLLG